ncbi:hypothetical protein D3C87_1714290 [compost metagenome]
MLCASARSACLAPANADMPSRPRTLAVAPVKKIEPRWRGSIARAASRPIRKPPKQAISHTLKYTREVVSRIGKLTLAPMLNTATSSGAMSRSMRAISATVSSSLRASQAKAWASPPSARIWSTSGASLSALRRVTQAI